MPSKDNQTRTRREANIDNASTNFLLVIIIAVILLLAMLLTYLGIIVVARIGSSGDEDSSNKPGITIPQGNSYPLKVEGIVIDMPNVSEAKNTISADLINSSHALLYDITANEIVASRQGGQIIYPASMTKVMTLIVVVENLMSESALDEVLTINTPRGEHSGYGVQSGEKLTVKDLIYAAVLQSDGVACITLAEYIAGSEANFVKLMNAKAREMGLSEQTTLFQNCTGLHHSLHYSTCRDIAIIMAYAMKNPFCANVLTTLSYRPSDNFRPGEKHTFWHMLLHDPDKLNDLRRQPTTATISGGKTGWTGSDSGRCVVTYAKGNDGHEYVLVTAKADAWSNSITDIMNIYNTYLDQ